MARSIMPVFIEAPQEAEIIGRLITGYGELEFDLANCLANFTHDNDSAFRALFRVRTESGRLQIATSLMRSPLTDLGLGPQCDDALGSILP